MPEKNDDRKLSRLLFMAREEIDMWADVVQSQTGRNPTSVRNLVKEIDMYRSDRGWSPYGFGNE